MVQAEMTTCYRLSVADFRRERDERGAFYDLTSSYLKALMGTIMQGTACNAVHPLEQRLARWLLMAHDRIGHHEFPLTQEFVAMMLAVSRPTVSLVAGTLQKSGLITYRRGRIAIVDRVGLEAASCECYATTTRILRAVTRAVIVSGD
jgi:CRP-like cAMP-binding protein